ncbi:ABC transporter permease [Sulfurisphaera ohwakuensis]|uniref:ABC transporter permease n=1 Tax=Sulfurisphaera ohwakuensis TaxID=69656 RepID=A0A650CJQ1_SULOH|nr:ABC transporter permease [Sulfurisphaera ohwakuensis]
MQVKVLKKIDFLIAFIKFYGISSIKRGFIYVLTYMAIPLAELFLIYMISRGAFLGYGIIGGLITVIASNGLSSTADFAYLRLEVKLQDLLVSSEVTPNDYILGLMLSNLVYSLPGIIVYVLLSIIFKLFNPIMILLLLLLLFNTSAIGFFISTLIPHMRYSWGIGGLLSTFLSIIPPIFYPYYLLPKVFFYILYPLPTTLSALIIQNYSDLVPLSKSLLAFSWILLVIETLIFYYISIRYSRWRSV